MNGGGLPFSGFLAGLALAAGAVVGLSDDDAPRVLPEWYVDYCASETATQC